MANEITIRNSLQIQNGNLDYRSRPTSFRANMSGLDGPVPGAVSCAVAPGTNIDLSELTTPGMCWVQNLDADNYVTIGMFDPESDIFYPTLELLPGEFSVFRLSRDIQEELGTGTGTVGPGTNRLRCIADTAACNVIFHVFEK